MAKKNKKSTKLANMTEEERLLFEEQLRQEEINMKKKQEILLNTFLTLKLQNEAKASKLNRYKLNHVWRNILRDMKCKELTVDINILRSTFERIMDRKENLIQTLIKDLDDADEQYQIALRSHIICMDDMIKIHTERISILHREYSDELSKLNKEFDSEMEFMKEQHQNQIENLKDILVAFDIHYNNKENEAQSEFSNICDEFNNRNMEEKHALRLVLEKKVNDLWAHFQAVTDHYNQATNERRPQLDSLRDKDEQNTTLISTQMRRIERLMNLIAGIRSRVFSVNRNYDDKNSHLRDERDRLMCQFQQMKELMQQLRDEQRNKLTNLSIKSNDSLKHMTLLISKAERILKFGEMCRKLETEEEKVLPFYKSSLSPEEIDATEHIVNHFTSQSKDEWVHNMHKYGILENFWKRFNKVKLDRLAAEKERNMLAQENTQLRQVLKSYLDGLSINGEIVTKPSTLLVVNERSNFQLSSNLVDPRVKPAPEVQLEAAHIVKYGVTSETLFKR